jgi:membrane associated rhomboid family serine protease
LARFDAEEDQQAGDLRAGLKNFSARNRQADASPSSRPWMTLILIGVNVLVFAAMAAMFQTVNGFTPVQLALSGGNSAPLDLSGQWWRLLSYQFLHANILHIAVNMWVLWTVGRLTERLYGSFNLILLYLASGILAGLASIVWNPELVSVGASGSIFGILGAFLALLARFRNEVPSSILRYWIPALLFAGYNLFAGAHQPGVDNAAHVGGLIAGFFLGLILAKEPGVPRTLALAQTGTALLFACACALLPLWYVDAFDHHPSTFEAFRNTHRWYMDNEPRDLQLWQSLALQLNSGTISTDDAAKSFEQNILPFWVDADARFQRELEKPNHDRNPFLPPAEKFAQLRLQWAQAIVSALRDGSPDGAQTAAYYAQQILPIQSEFTRLNLRSVAENLPTPLSQSIVAIWVSRELPELGPACVEPPAFMEKPLSATDSIHDGPAQRHAAGCQAQEMFLMGDYQTLDGNIKKYARTLPDLPDGSSRLEGVWNGLDNLFSYSQISVEEAMRRLVQWREKVKGSSEPDLVEAEMFRVWAYSARGHGYASSVSEQAMQLFSARSLMASASLRDAAPTGAYDPVWYVLAIGNDRDQSVSWQVQEDVFNLGAKRFRDYLPLHSQILVSLMPRWGGSIEAVDDFIRTASTKDGQIDPVSYARLYLMYGNLEGDDFNVIKAAHADPKLMEQGMAALRIRYPQSDYILNATARFACIDHEWDLYRSLSSRLAGHSSAQAWPDKLSIAKCNTQSL